MKISLFRWNRSSKLAYRRFLISYILILVIPITLGSFVYYKALDIIEKDARDERMFVLKQSCTFVDNYFRDVERVIISISIDPKLQNIMYMSPPDYGASNIYSLNDAQRALGAYSFSTSFESSFYIFLKQADIVFEHESTQPTVHLGISRFFDNYIRYGDIAYENWYNEMLNHFHDKEVVPAQKMHAKNEWNPPANNIAYVQTIPLDYSNRAQGAVEVLINADDINKLLNDVDKSGSGWTYILDEKGRIITGVSNGRKEFPVVSIDRDKPAEYRYEKINGTNMIVMSMKSNFRNWAYVTVLPVTTIMTKANYIKNIILVIMVVSLVAGLIFSLLLARRNVKPIKEVIHTLTTFFNGEIEKGRNEYDFLKYGIRRLINANEDMHATVNKQAILLKSSFLGRLIKGEFGDEKEIEMQRNHLEMSLEGMWYAAAIVDLHGQNLEIRNKEQLIEQDIYRLILDRTLSSHFAKEGYTYILNPFQIVFILSFDNKSRAECMKRMKSLIETISNELVDSYNLFVDFFTGSPYNRLIDISLSYNEAADLLSHMNVEHPGRHITFFWEEKLENTGYYYPLEMEQKLINLAMAGNFAEVAKVLDALYSENFKNRKLTNYMEYHLLFDMRGTILKSLERAKTDIEAKELLSSKNSSMQPKEIFESIRKTYENICNTASDKKKSHNSNLLEKLTAHIESNYYSPEIGVASVAAEFGISESYLSQFFKEQTGQAFSEYVEKLRINHACEILKTNGISVEDIAKLVGYNSAYSFRRAFKRSTGVLPTVFRG